MSQNEVDQITQETGRTFRRAIDAARRWMSTQHQSIRGRKLTRQKRDEMARYIEAEIGAERIVAAWFEKRVADYQHEARSVAAMRGTPNQYSPELVSAAQSRLAAMRERIETTLHSSGLALEHRGQVAQALDSVGRDPVATTGPVFTYMTATEAMHARAAGVESELRTYARQETAYQQAVARAEAAQPIPASMPRSPSATAAAAAERAVVQADAVQKIRHAQNEWARDQIERKYGNQTQWEREKAARNAEKAGLTPEQIRWEFDNTEANSRCRVQIDSQAPDGGSQTNLGYFATETEAAEWVNKTITETNWKAGTQFAVRARENGDRKPFYLAEGNQTKVGRDTERWHRDADAAARRNSARSQTSGTARESDSAPRPDRGAGGEGQGTGRPSRNASGGDSSPVEAGKAAMAKMRGTSAADEHDRQRDRSRADNAAAAQQSSGAEAARSPLADYQTGSALANAMERNGTEREGMER